MMLGFIKKYFFTGITFFSYNVLNVNSLQCVSMNNECKIRSEIINVNTNEPMFYPYSITMNKRKSSCNTINDSYAKLRVPDTIKNINIKVCNLMSRTNEKRNIEWHKTCKCKCRLDASVCNNKQRWDEDKCRRECKELINKGMCDKGFISNPSNCECECDKLCDLGEYLDYENCKCRKRLIDNLVDKCNESIDGNKMLQNESFDVIRLNVYKKVCNSCTIYIILFAMFFIKSICISSVFIYFHWYFKKDNFIVKFNPSIQTTICETYKWKISSKLVLKIVHITFLMT